MESDVARLDWDALIGWAMTALPMLLLVGIVWYRRWRRDPRAFMERLGTTEAVIELAAPLAQVPDALAGFGVELSDGGTRLTYRGGNGEGRGRAEVAQLAQALTRAGIAFTSLDIHDSSLEDIFVGLLGKEEVPA